MAASPRCRKCDREFERPTKIGRIPSYCSVGCRRAAEREIRRADRAVEQMEERARWARINDRRDPVLARFESERVRLEERLRLLLDDEDVTT